MNVNPTLAEIAGPLPPSVTARHLDLADDVPPGTYDLVSAQSFHSVVALDRARVLRTAAASPTPAEWSVDHADTPRRQAVLRRAELRRAER